MNVQASTELNIPPKVAWEALQRKETFLFVTRGAMRYTGTEAWPVRLMESDVEVNTTVFPLGLLPGTSHTFRVVRVDDDAMEIQTEEHGGLIRSWNHTMKIESLTDSVCRYTDRVQLDAGFLTPLVWLIAVVFYRYRQLRWRSLATKLRSDL